MTNTYLPFIGGVERSVEIFSSEYLRLGHNVLIVAPTYENVQKTEKNVIRVPALQKFNGTDFSVQLPVPGLLNSALNDFKPQIVHSQHPFMLGDSALRIAAQYRIPIVYTFHTYYESYTHYVPGNSPALKRFVIALVTGYANLCDHVFAPSTSVASELKKRGVEAQIDIVPTGIEVDQFQKGDGRLFRKICKIPENAFVIGFVSRIAPEKNVYFLAKAIYQFMQSNDSVHFIVAGTGPSADDVCKIFEGDVSLSNRFHYKGLITGQDLVDVYHSMDIFVFASKTETQGLVIAEAMAAGLPVIALDSPAIGDVVQDNINGKLLQSENVFEYCKALKWFMELSDGKIKKMKQSAINTANLFSKLNCAQKALSIYSSLLTKKVQEKNRTDSGWAKAIRLFKAEFELIKNMTKATGAAINDSNNISDA